MDPVLFTLVLLVGLILGGLGTLSFIVWSFVRSFGLWGPEADASWDIVIGPVTIQKGERMSVLKRLTTEEQCRLALELKTRKGRAARVDGVPTFVSSNPAVLALLAVEGDPFASVARGVSPGAAQVVVTVDADLGEGVRTVTGSIDFEVVGAEAAALEVHAGPAEEQPDTEPAAAAPAEV